MKIIPFRTDAALAAKVSSGAPLTAGDYRAIRAAIERALGPEELGHGGPRSRYPAKDRPLKGRDTVPSTIKRT